MLRHELVELLLVLGVAQTLEEIFECARLLLKAPQRIHAVFVERAVAARGRAKGKAASLHPVAHPLHLALHPLHLVRPAVLTPATHFSAPESEQEKGKANRPP